MSELEKYFTKFRENIIGINEVFESPYGENKIVYADWIASGRLYAPIEDKIKNDFGPYVGNTHTETSITGTAMTRAYHKAREIIKSHVNAHKDDILITAGFGMTAAVNKFQRILGLRICEQWIDSLNISEELRPVVFITHMEHHSNQTSWLETICDVEIIQPDKFGFVDLNDFEMLLEKYKNRKMILGSFSAASNVTGIRPPIYTLAKMIHNYGGYCFIDFAAAAPYVNIDMHPKEEDEYFDAIFFSPHKFLGGPGTSGMLIFNSKLYKLKIPDHPGGGTVDWTNPWKEHKYVNDIEAREDGGTPGFLQSIRTALCIKLKEQMKVEKIAKREDELLKIAFNGFDEIPKVHILAGEIKERLGIISFYVEGIHHNLMVKLLNDRYGIQTRGGCSCAGTYGHYLLNVDPIKSKTIIEKINQGDLSLKPGWVRLSLHPTMTNDELNYSLNAIKEIVKNIDKWQEDYTYSNRTNEFYHKNEKYEEYNFVRQWFKFD
ncbi:MAG: aminotransferase class V-fold PLP-dependent enzyme [Ignavibacteriales bacterium]|nr:aminotransferase class V-fold PLP-dependent enzyme [Ignavibacteriales bacterium]